RGTLARVRPAATRRGPRHDPRHAPRVRGGRLRDARRPRDGAAGPRPARGRRGRAAGARRRRRAPPRPAVRPADGRAARRPAAPGGRAAGARRGGGRGVSDPLALLIGLLLLLLNAFFVGAEFALISARRSTIEPRAQEGSR